MKTELINWIADAWRLLLSNTPWMAWNLFLAFVPLALSIWLFHGRQARSHLWWILLLLAATLLPQAPFVLKYGIRFFRDNRTNYVVWLITLVFILWDIWLMRRSPRSRSFFWWVGFLIFIAFLPNAPYVLTDVIHLITDIRDNYSVWVITLVLIPQYLVFILGGFEAYVLSLINLGYYLQRNGWGKFVIWAELALHALSAVGIYLGRFLRFNSWDFVTQPRALANSVMDDLASKRPVLVMVVTFIVITGLYWLMKQVSLGILIRNRFAFATDSRTRNTLAIQNSESES